MSALWGGTVYGLTGTVHEPIGTVHEPIGTRSLAAIADGGILEWAGQAAALAGTLLLALFLLALAGIAYKHLLGDGIEWPEDRDGNPGDSNRNADDPGPRAPDTSGDETAEPIAGGGTDETDESNDAAELRRGREDEEWEFY